jgi:hypothetical protein
VDAGWVDDEPGQNVIERHDNSVGREEDLREGDTANGRVIKGALKPLCCVGVRGVLVEVGKVAAEASNALASHRIALVGHRARANLVLLKRLFHLLLAGKVTDVAGNALDGCAESGHGVGDTEIDLAGVGLGGDAVAGWEVRLLAENLVELIDLHSVAVEDFHASIVSPQVK